MITTQRKPRRRSESFINFSREHHYGLLLSWEIKQGLKSKVEPNRITDYILYLFDNDILHHMREEEKIVFSKIGSGSELLKKTLRFRQKVYGFLAAIRAGEGNVGLLKKFAELLNRAVRFEERVLFPYLEENLGKEQLELVLNSYEHKPQDISQEYHDKFWEFKKKRA